MPRAGRRDPGYVDAASAESHRVRERDQGSARARRRSRDSAARRRRRATASTTSRTRCRSRRRSSINILSAARNLSAQAVGNPRPRAGRRAVHDRQRARAAVPRRRFAARHARRRAHRALLPERRRVPAQHRRPRHRPLGLRPGAREHARSRRSTAASSSSSTSAAARTLKELDQIGAPAVDAINARLKNIPFTATAGVHRLGVTFLHRSFAESDRQLYALVPGGGQDAVHDAEPASRCSGP